MRRIFKAPIFIRIFIFLSVLGPSVITTMAGNDGGGVITYSIAGARLGYAALLTLPLLTVLYAVTQEMGSRLAIVTGKGLGDLIRERFGVRTALVIFLLLSIANFGSIITNVAAVKTSSELLGIPSMPVILMTITASFLLVAVSSYEKSQNIFLSGIVFYFAYVFSAMKGNPDWGKTIQHLFIPTNAVFSREYLITSIAVLGTTITPWGQFFVQSYMKDKNVPIEKLGFAKLEAALGAFLSNFFTFFIIVATAATLFTHRIPLSSGEQAALAIKPAAGELAGTLFAIGLVNAAVIGMIIVALSSAYAFSEFFGYTGSLDEPYKKGKIFYTIFLLNLLISAALVMTPYFPLFTIVVYTQSLNALLLPIFFYFLIKFANNPDLVGKYKNGRIYNYIAISAALIIVLAGVIAVIFSLIPK